MSHELHNKALEISSRYRRAESELLDILQRIEKEKVFLELGFPSMFVYATEALKLSEDVAYCFINVARKSAQIPELKEEIQNGNISVSKAKKITSVLTPENKSQWLSLAKELPQRRLEQEVARVNPKASVPETVQFITADRLKMQLSISENLFSKLRHLQDLVSQKSQAPADLEATLALTVEAALEKHDPVRKAKRADKRQATKTSPPHVSKQQVLRPVPFSRTPVPAAGLHQIWSREQGQCSHRDLSGKRCPSRRWLHVHHKIPISHGGSNNTDNLQLLCSGHHRMIHLKHVRTFVSRSRPRSS